MSTINATEIITINTKHGDDILINKDDYDLLLETLSYDLMHKIQARCIHKQHSSK